VHKLKTAVPIRCDCVNKQIKAGFAFNSQTGEITPYRDGYKPTAQAAAAVKTMKYETQCLDNNCRTTSWFIPSGEHPVPTCPKCAGAAGYTGQRGF
jgi:hypothetical protein